MPPGMCTVTKPLVFMIILDQSYLVSKGFRFATYRGEKVDIIYGNVKHAFFQVSSAITQLLLILCLGDLLKDYY